MTNLHRHHTGAARRALAPWIGPQSFHWRLLTLLMMLYSLLAAVILWSLFT